MRADLVQAEARIPHAMASAFRDGNVGIMDYMGHGNIESDTSMPGTIAGEDGYVE